MLQVHQILQCQVQIIRVLQAMKRGESETRRKSIKEIDQVHQMIVQLKRRRKRKNLKEKRARRDMMVRLKIF